MKRLPWTRTTLMPKDLPEGTLLLAGRIWDSMNPRGPYIEEVLLLVKERKFFTMIASSVSFTSDKFSILHRSHFMNVRVLDRSDLPLCLNMHGGKKFHDMIKEG